MAHDSHYSATPPLNLWHCLTRELSGDTSPLNHSTTPTCHSTHLTSSHPAQALGRNENPTSKNPPSGQDPEGVCGAHSGTSHLDGLAALLVGGGLHPGPHPTTKGCLVGPTCGEPGTVRPSGRGTAEPHSLAQEGTEADLWRVGRKAKIPPGGLLGGQAQPVGPPHSTPREVHLSVQGGGRGQPALLCFCTQAL